MDPITLGVLGASAVSGLAQYMSSQQARGASKAELQKIQDLYTKMSTPQFDENGTPLPGFDVSQLSPDEYKVVAQYVPQVAQQIKEAAPQVVKNSADMQTGRQAQLDALNKLRQVGSGAPDAEFEAKQQQAARTAGIDAHGTTDAILQQQARRGMLGSGNQLAAQLQGASSAMDRQAQTSSQAAADSYRNQLQAVRDSATLGGQINQSDQNMQARNADIINAYNARGAQAAQTYQNQRAGTLNQANQYNQNLAQQTANQNTALNNQYQQYNQQYGNQMAQQGYNNAEQQRTALNQLRQNSFADQMNINAGQSGAFQGMSANALGTGQDRNAAIGALGNAATSALMYSGSQSRADKRAGMDDGEEDAYGNYG